MFFEFAIVFGIDDRDAAEGCQPCVHRFLSFDNCIEHSCRVFFLFPFGFGDRFPRPFLSCRVPVG